MNWKGPISHGSRNEKLYGDLRYFKFVCCPLYLITVNVIEALVKGIDSFDGYVIDIEDVFITGILAEKLHIKRKQLMTLIKRSYGCNLFNSVILCSVFFMGYEKVLESI